MTQQTRDPIAVATQKIHEAVSGITVLESIALLEVAAAYYKTHLIDQIKAKQESIYIPTPDDRSDVV
jgi:hypothetical protein